LLGATKPPNQPHLISNRASHVLIHCSFSLFNHEDDDSTVTTTTRRREQKDRNFIIKKKKKKKEEKKTEI
jgi:hypothetical protein